MPSLRRACRDAGRHALLFGNMLVVDTIDTERTLPHHALIFVELARTIRACPRAQLAADTDVGVHQHDTVLRTLVAGAGWTDGDASGLLAMQARPREMHGAAVRSLTRFVGMHAVQPHAIRMVLIRIEIRQRR